MTDLDENSFDTHSELSDVDQLSEGSDEVSEASEVDYDDFSDIIKEGGAKKSVEQIELAAQDVEELDDGGEDDDEDEDEEYLKKFDKELRKNYLVDFHPEALSYNNLEIQTLSEVIRDSDNIIVDEFHKTIPFLTKYEKTRILGLRAKQIDNGAKPFIDAARYNLIDGYVIAQKELETKRLPFIIRRPLPNGGSEFWKLSDLQIIH